MLVSTPVSLFLLSILKYSRSRLQTYCCVQVDMQRYQWPGYGIQLLGELQRQQNDAQFCDTLLQTEGISVPTHSCILAALSPYLSQKLSASPSPPSGQKHQLQLQAVGAQTLLKLVGLLYSGELEVKGGVEQNDVLSAARQFGITDLVEGQKDERMKEGTPQKKSSRNSKEGNESRVMQDIPGSPAEKRSLVSTGTQTVKAAEKTAGSSVNHSGQVRPPNQEPASFVAQSLDFSILLQPQNITLDKQACSTSFPPIPSMPRGAPSSDGSALDRSSLSVTNPMSASLLSSSVIFLSDESTFLSPQEDGTCQQPSERKTYDKMADSREDAEQPSHPKRNEILGNCAEKRQAHANVGAKSLAKMKQMQQMMETTQISIKVKLRRRTKGDAWEVVSGHDDTLSALTCLEQKDGSNLLQPATTNSPEAPLHSNTTYGTQLPLSDCFTPTTNSSLESVLLPQPPAPGEESDEQIEKLLEDIMMDLNILPNFKKDCKRSPHLQLSHDGAAASCQVPITADSQAPSRMHATVSAAGGVYYQDFEAQIGDKTTDTDVHCCFTAGNPASCSVLPSVFPNVVLIQQQSSLHCHSSLSSMGQKYRSSRKDMPSSKDPKGTCPEAPTTVSVSSAAFCSSGQTLHHPVCQGPPSQDDHNILTNGNEVLSSPSFSLPCMDELRLRQCLSPLEQFAPAAEHQLVVNNCTTNQSATARPQPSLQGRPWLTEEPASLQFPLRAMAHTADRSVSLPLDTNSCCCSKQQQKHMELNSQNRVTWTVSPGLGNTAVMTSEPREKKEHLGCKQGNAAVPQRRNKEHSVYPPGAASSLSAYRDVKVSDGTKAQLSLNACSVSLSCNNMLAREREMATSSSNILNKFVEKPNELPTLPESPRETDGEPRDLGTNQTRIRTRGFLKRTLETADNAHLERSSGVKPMACGANTVIIQGVSPPRRKRGRPPKKKFDEISSESCPAVAEKSHNVESEPLVDNSLPKKKESDRIKTSCKKRRKTGSLVEVIPLKKTISNESTGNNNDIVPAGRNPGTLKQSRGVTLKELQKLITCQRSKTRKANERQDKETGEPASDVSGKGKACGNTGEGLTKERELDSDIKECHVTVGKTTDHILNKWTDECKRWQRDEPNSSLTKESTVVTDEDQPQFSFHVLEEEVIKLAAERGQPLEHPHEAQRRDDAGAAQAAQQTAVRDEGSSISHTNTHLPEKIKMPFDHNLEPQTSEKTGPPLLAAVGFSKSLGCTEEEEEEVDILLYSPDKVPQIRECKGGLDSMDGSPEEEEEEEEEEEDATEVDVTGDEAE